MVKHYAEGCLTLLRMLSMHAERMLTRWERQCSALVAETACEHGSKCQEATG